MLFVWISLAYLLFFSWFADVLKILVMLSVYSIPQDLLQPSENVRCAEIDVMQEVGVGAPCKYN